MINAYPESGSARLSRIRQGAALIAACCSLLCAAPTLAAAYPSKPIKVIVPFPPGGGTDVAARMFTTRLSELMGQPFVVDNRGGATGTIGTNAAAQAAPDGYTLLIGSLSSHVLAPLSMDNSAPTADPVKDFRPVAMLAFHPMVLSTHPSVPATSVDALVNISKESPNPLFYSSMGTGSLFHIAGAELQQLTGAKLEHVPYRGAAPAMADLIGGQVQMMFVTIQSALPHIQSGNLRALAVTARTRSPLLPDVPALAEIGLGDFDVESWVGLFAPAGTPDHAIDALVKAVDALAHDEAFVKQADSTGTVIPRLYKEEFGKAVAKDQEKFRAWFQQNPLEPVK